MTCIGVDMGRQLVTDTAVDIGMACDMVKKRTQGNPTACIIQYVGKRKEKASGI